MTSTDASTTTTSHRFGRWVPLSVLACAAAVVAVAWWMTGPAPKPVDNGVSKDPPPLALPGDVPTGSTLARAAAALATGDLGAARRGFTDVVADDPQSQPGQVGLVLSGWRRVGTSSVQRDLEQLAREYPDSAYVATHLALVQSLRGDARRARATLRDARSKGWSAADATSLRMATIADELLHPDAFRGYVPVLVAPTEVPPSDRAAVRTLLDDVQRNDRAGAAKLAGRLARSSSAMVRVAAAAAAFEKDRPEAAAAALERLARGRTTPAAAADRARLLGALATAWAGGDGRATACERLGALVRPGADVDPATERLAAPIRHELC